MVLGVGVRFLVGLVGIIHLFNTVWSWCIVLGCAVLYDRGDEGAEVSSIASLVWCLGLFDEE